MSPDVRGCDALVTCCMLDRMAATKDEVVLAFAGVVEQIPRATEFRSTWLASSLQGLRQRGHFEHYVSLLSGHQDEILNAVAAAWVPVAIAQVHYETCERLGLPPGEVEAMARDSGAIRRQWYATIIASAYRDDTTIWTILAQLQKLWLRSANGGAVAVYRLGPKRARVEYARCALLEIAYFREALRVVLLLLGEHICDGMTIVQAPTRLPEGAAYAMQWSNTRTEPPKPID
jgi:hypothetical protein